MNNVSLYRIVHYQLPHVFRQLKTLAWLKVSVTYLQAVLLRFDEAVLEFRRLAYLTPQVCYLEKYLRTRFGDNSITIVDIEDVELYAYTTAEHPEEELYLIDGGTYFYTSAELAAARFAVQCSEDAYDAYGQSINATVARYKLPGFQFLMQIMS